MILVVGRPVGEGLGSLDSRHNFALQKGVSAGNVEKKSRSGQNGISLR